MAQQEVLITTENAKLKSQVPKISPQDISQMVSEAKEEDVYQKEADIILQTVPSLLRKMKSEDYGRGGVDEEVMDLDRQFSQKVVYGYSLSSLRGAAKIVADICKQRGYQVFVENEISDDSLGNINKLAIRCFSGNT